MSTKKPISLAAVGLAVDDQVYHAKPGVAYAQIREKVPGFPVDEGGLNETDDAEIFERSTNQMAGSGLFREDPNGIKGMYVERNPGGGLNALLFVAGYARQLGLPSTGGFFALGTDGGEYDTSAKYLIESGEAAGIDMSGCFPLKGGTARTVAVVRKTESGDLERSFIHSPGVANNAYAPDYMGAADPCQIQAATFYYLNIARSMCLRSGTGIRVLFEEFKRRKTLTVLDTGGDLKRMRNIGLDGYWGPYLGRSIDIFAPSAKEAYHLTGRMPFERMAVQLGYAESGPGIVIFKNGPAGSTAFTWDNNNLSDLSQVSGGSNHDWTYTTSIVPSFDVEEGGASVGTGDKSLATGIVRLITRRVSTPKELLIAINAGGALAVQGKPLTQANLDDILKNGIPRFF
ncbi:MAG TPA: carbohydrate kinase family protein [Candidatus Nanoarchaeia archaeon]|nr:carbohydrate kinase family protein [Candidatus Nanoarchaeia archaeon]